MIVTLHQQYLCHDCGVGCRQKIALVRLWYLCNAQRATADYLSLRCCTACCYSLLECQHRGVTVEPAGVFATGAASMPCTAAASRGPCCCQGCKFSCKCLNAICAGLLTGGDTYAYQVAPPEKVASAAKWKAVAENHGVSLPAVAIAFAALPVRTKKPPARARMGPSIALVLPHGCAALASHDIRIASERSCSGWPP